MHKSIALVALLAALALAGCTSPQYSEETPYTDAQVRQFALEMFGKSGLPPEQLAKVRRALLKQDQRMSNAIRDVQPSKG
ncbi:hypothetical protein [Pseudomonas tohonis]|uniref:hypothetical protein n=1 Tax=Pseudomonas tohonis TaxID=2725477 RepID=UPI0021D9CC4D|nr:hypothetical protein [Pseudomonas tohonis]UXY55481.1 hypothetical protein N9L84_13210 [Pseudomonas tohonis]